MIVQVGDRVQFGFRMGQVILAQTRTCEVLFDDGGHMTFLTDDVRLMPVIREGR